MKKVDIFSVQLVEFGFLFHTNILEYIIII